MLGTAGETKTLFCEFLHLDTPLLANQLCAVTGCQVDQPKAMSDREGWCERVKVVHISIMIDDDESFPIEFMWL